MKDERLYELLALVNKLPGKHGKAVTQLKRGQRLIIPSVLECKEYLQQKCSDEVSVGNTRKQPTLNSLQQEDPDASTRPAAAVECGATPPEGAVGLSLKGAAVLSGSNFESGDSPVRSRLLSQADLGEVGSPLALRLEIDHGGVWTPIIEYEISGEQAFVRVYTAAGRQRQTSIDLPTRAARELAENDLSANCEIYCRQFLANRFAF
jgi:hypothetical protein